MPTSADRSSHRVGDAGRSASKLTPSQRALWASQRRYPDVPLQNMALLTHLDGEIDVHRLADAFAAVVRASETLRLTIGEGDAASVVSDAPLVSQIIELPRSAARPWADQRVLEPVDVSVAVYDSVIIAHGDGTASWYLCLHHVATDATSSALVFQATAAAYHGEGIDIGGPSAVDPVISKRRQRAIDFWSTRPKAPLIESLYQPIDTRTTETVRRRVAGPDVDRIEAALDGPYRMISRDLAWTSLLMTALSVQLHRVSGADRFAIGLPVHNRSGRRRQQEIGPLMEVYPVDITVDPGATFAELHASVSKQVMTVVGQAMPDVGAVAADVSGIVNVIARGSFGSFGPAPTSTEWIHPNAADPFHLLGVQLTTYGSESPDLELDINVAGANAGHQLDATDHFARILDAMIETPTMPIVGHALVSASDQATAPVWGSGAPLADRRFVLDPSRPRATGSVVDRLSVALSNGTRPVVVDQDTTLTGRALWSRAGAVAGSLSAAGIGPGHRVGVEISRSADAVIAILGILRAGASYVPIDPSHPESRRTSLSDRADVTGVLTDLDGIDQSATFDAASVAIEADSEAYVLFTSGSTGEPKGVPITHGGLADYLAFASQHYLGPKQRRPVAPLFTSLGFDLTVTSLFLPLIAGGTLVIVRDDGVPGLRSVASRSDLTWIKATPSHLELLSRLLPQTHRVSTMVVGGEAFPARLANELSTGHPGLDIFNEYGPTEAVVGCMIHRFDPAASTTGDVPIGHPAPGVELRIVDRGGHDVPTGVAGELLISSSGLSHGYLGHEPDTAPFARRGDRRWYASGDVVRIAGSEGAVYLGRIDDQIKLNGVRLEPAEVVAAIESHPAVSRAVVRLWQPAGDKRPVLAAWVEQRADAEPVEPVALRAFLLSRLASHQIPSAVAVVDELTFNNNGKLDTEALPSPHRVQADPSTRADQTFDEPTAQLVRQVWEQALGMVGEQQTIQASDDFFVLGGDSLAALEMTADLSSVVDAEISESLVFDAPTFGDFVAAVVALDRTQRPAVGPVAGGGGTGLSPGERAMMFEHRVAPDSARYNIGRRYIVDGRVDAARLRRAGEAVVARHAPLHTTFGAERRALSPKEALHFSTPSLDDAPAMSDELSSVAAGALYRAPFDLENGPLLRIALHRLTGERSAIVVVSHHISGDAGSLDRLWADLDAAYSGRALEPLAISYADHAAWQRQRDVGASHWAELWQAPVETSLGLPGATGDGADGYAEQGASFTASALRNGPGRTPTATVLAALAKLLDRHHRPDTDERPGRYAIGLTASVREHAQSEPMVGYFLNTLPLVIEVSAGNTSTVELADHASRVLAAALPHRSHPFADMVATARREGRQLPIPEVLLAVEDLAPAELDGSVVEHEVIASGEAIATATVFVQIRGERVDLGIEYAGSALGRSRALLLLDDLDALIAQTLSDASSRSSAIVLPSEQHSVLRGDPAADDAPLVPAMLGNFASGRAAARCASATLTWDALGRRSAVMAEQLQRNGVGPGDRVAVSLTRSVDLVVAVVAAMRCGAVYVPLDPGYPADRRELILRAASPVLAIIDPGGDLPWLPCLTVPGDRAEAVVFADHQVRPSDPAYVIFTSGSTGVPKGVEVSHGQLATSTRARETVYGPGPERFLLLSSIGFDSSIVGLFWTLFSGGEIVLPTEVEAHDPDALLGLVQRSTVSHVLMVPSLYRALLSRGADEPHWPAVVTVAGEACPADLVAQHHALRPRSELWNEYGPTEGTVWATAHRCRVGDVPVPIGRPIPGAWCAVVDRAGVAVPLGASGELMIGGAGIVAGYLPDTADGSSATRSAFVEHDTLGSAYRTGDAAAVAVSAAGEPTLRFLGRVDEQLNIGGVRLEPAEVERVLVSVDGVTGAAVVISSAETARRSVLVAHLEGQDIDIASVRSAVIGALPAAARPAHYITHGVLPKTPHGKLDRTALADTPLPDEPGGELATEDAALTKTQRDVLDLFRRNVGSEIGFDDGFFDAGGDSLAALTLAIDLEERFDASFSVTALLAEPTARAVAQHFSNARPDPAAADAENSDAAAVPEPSLVEWIRAGDADRPILVLIAPGSGHLIGYEPLIRSVDAATPVLGVRLPGYDGKDDPVVRVDELASIVGPLLDDALARRFAAGGECNVVLLGGSSGGLLAWELQARAENAGRPFASVVMQDTVHPDWRREQAAVGLVEDMRRRLRNGGIAAVLTEIYGRGERKLSRWRRKRRSDAQAAISGAEMPAVIAQRMFDATTKGLLAYEPPKLSSNVLFLAASTTDPDATFSRWSTIAGSLEVETFAGDHFGDNGITAAANVAPVAARVDAALQALTP